MKPSFEVATDDIAAVPSDILLLKHADGFYGADAKIAEILVKAKRCREDELALKPEQWAIIETHGTIAPARVMFLGTPPLQDFGYSEMRHLAHRAVDILAEQKFTIDRLTTTIHGANYGLDIEEALQNLADGFEEKLASIDYFRIGEIFFVDHNARRAHVLAVALHRRRVASTYVAKMLNPARESPPPGRSNEPNRTEPISQPAQVSSPPTSQKKHVFVAMPFSEEMEDVYEYGIYAPVRNCGLICEKTNESAYTGDILQRIKDRIETANLVVAEMTGSRPNVYLEVGYAWGKGVPVIFLARGGEQLHFDVSRHRCIYYKSIRQLGRELEKLLRGLFGLEDTAA